MISAILCSDVMTQDLVERSAPETDTIPRIKIRDLLSSVRFLSRNNDQTLESLRVKLNTDRQLPSGGTSGYSVARDVASELDRLGLASVGALPKDAKGFEKKRKTLVRLSDEGSELADNTRKNLAEAYFDVLRRMYASHPYVRRFVRAVMRRPFIVPVITSAKQHISPKYVSAKVLADDIASGCLDTPSLLDITATRIGRALTAQERNEIQSAVDALVGRLETSAGGEPQTEFVRKMSMALNEIVVPAMLRADGLGFDFNSFRRLCSMGTEFQISWATSAHPRHDGWLAFSTANVDFDVERERILAVRFSSGIKQIANDFLDRLFSAYSLMQEWGQPSVVTAWELRATFCFENRTAPRVFDALFCENYGGSDVYRIDKDFSPRNKPTHEEPLNIGGRPIGLVRISKR